MIDIGLGQIISALLLAGRAVSSYYLLKVIKVQRRLLQLPAVDEKGEPDLEVMHFRRTLSYMTMVILLGQVVPIIIDLVHTIYGVSPSWLIYVYAVYNVITAITASILIWRLYQMAVHVDKVSELEKAHIRSNN